MTHNRDRTPSGRYPTLTDPLIQSNWRQEIQCASASLADSIESLLRRPEAELSALDQLHREFVLAALRAATRIPNVAAAVANLATVESLGRGES